MRYCYIIILTCFASCSAGLPFSDIIRRRTDTAPKRLSLSSHADLAEDDGRSKSAEGLRRHPKVVRRQRRYLWKVIKHSSIAIKKCGKLLDDAIQGQLFNLVDTKRKANFNSRYRVDTVANPVALKRIQMKLFTMEGLDAKAAAIEDDLITYILENYPEVLPKDFANFYIKGVNHILSRMALKQLITSQPEARGRVLKDMTDIVLIRKEVVRIGKALDELPLHQIVTGDKLRDIEKRLSYIKFANDVWLSGKWDNLLSSK